MASVSSRLRQNCPARARRGVSEHEARQSCSGRGASLSRAPPGDMADEDVKIHAGAVVSGEADIRGDVTIHPRSAVHPKAVIVADPGKPIVIGSGNIVEERAYITSKDAAVTIGDSNHLHAGCRLQSCQLGDGNIVEPNSSVGSGCTLQNACVVGALVSVPERTTLASGTVVYGRPNSEHVLPQPEAELVRARKETIDKELELLQKVFTKTP